MTEKKNIFQTVLLVVFGFGIVLAVTLFSLSKATSSKNVSNVVFWGTFPPSSMLEALDLINDNSETNFVSVTYVEKNPETYNAELVEGFASGTGPDIFLINQDMIVPYQNKISPLPYESFPERDFALRYTDGAKIFLSNEGVFAFPLGVDPLVMYYNKSMFNTAGIVNPPSLWSQFSGLVPLLTKKDENKNILKSGLAFGQFSNIQYANNILETMLLQLGDPIVVRDAVGNFSSVVNNSNSTATNPLILSMEFFTNFSDPLLDTYSWNSALSSAEDMFVQDRLAIYFAPASRFLDIQRKNINLNYDISKIPQVNENTNFVTSGEFYAIAVAKSSKSPQASFTAANLISNGPATNSIVSANKLAPVRRDLLTTNPLDSYGRALRESALISYTWLNPDAGATQAYFKEAIDTVVRGSVSASAAARRVDSQLVLLLNSFNQK